MRWGSAFLAIFGVLIIGLLGGTVLHRQRSSAAYGRGLGAVDGYVKREMRRGRISAEEVIIVRDRDFVFTGRYGRGVTDDTRFRLGSTTKSMTAVAVAQLAAAGKVDFDAPVTQYIPSFRTSDAPKSSRITIRMLLNQTSGFTMRTGWNDLTDTGTSLASAVRRLDHERLASTPGAKWQYSNTNYDVLGLVVERVSGQRYDEYMKDHVFTPLGMYNSSAGPVSGLARGHRTWFGIPIPATAPYTPATAPAGLVSTTGRDAARYVSAHLGQVPMPELDAAAVEQLHRAGKNANGYAMGWFAGRFGGVPAVYHTGDIFTYSSAFVLLPERHTGIVVLTNQGFLPSQPGARLAEGVTRIVSGRSAPVAGARATGIVVVIDFLMAALLATAFMRAIGLRWWRQPAAVQPLLMYDIVLPLALLGLLWRGAPLSVAWWGLPDITACVVLASAVLLFCAVVHVAVRVAGRADHAAVGDTG